MVSSFLQTFDHYQDVFIFRGTFLVRKLYMFYFGSGSSGEFFDQISV